MSRPAAGPLLLVAVLAWAPPALAQSDSSWEASPGLLVIGGWVVLLNAAGPLSYATLAPRDLPPDAVPVGPITGRACQLGLSTPALGFAEIPRLSGAVGDGGFQKALEDIRARHPELRGIYDVKVDEHRQSILTVFHRRCTEVTASGFR